MRVTVRTSSHDGVNRTLSRDGVESTLLGGAEEKARGGSGRGNGLRLSRSPRKGPAGGEGEAQQMPTEYLGTGSALWRDGVAGSVARGARGDGRAGGRVRPLSAKAALNCCSRKTVGKKNTHARTHTHAYTLTSVYAHARCTHANMYTHTQQALTHIRLCACVLTRTYFFCLCVFTRTHTSSTKTTSFVNVCSHEL
jgi:hypothetical protein